MQTIAGTSYALVALVGLRTSGRAEAFLRVEDGMNEISIFVHKHRIADVVYLGGISIAMLLRLEQRAYRVGVHSLDIVRDVLACLPVNQQGRLKEEYAEHRAREVKRKDDAKKKAALAKKAQYSSQDPYYPHTPGFRTDQYGLY